jgi:hypothetical protein
VVLVDAIDVDDCCASIVARLLRCIDDGGRTDSSVLYGSVVLGLYDGGASDGLLGDIGAFRICTLEDPSSLMDSDDCQLCRKL